MTSAVQDARDDELAMETTEPRTISQLRTRSRSPNAIVGASSVIARFAAENHCLRD